jgi:hypothetical protein
MLELMCISPEVRDKDENEEHLRGPRGKSSPLSDAPFSDVPKTFVANSSVRIPVQFGSSIFSDERELRSSSLNQQKNLQVN